MFSAKNYGLPKDLIEAAKRVHEKQLEEGTNDKMPSKEHVMKMLKDGMSETEMMKMHSDVDKDELKKLVKDCKQEMKEERSTAKRVHEKQLEEQQKPISLKQAAKRVGLAVQGVIPKKATKPSAKKVYNAMGGTEPMLAKKPQAEEVQFTEEELAEAFAIFLEENFHVDMLTEEDLDYVFEEEFPQWLEEQRPGEANRRADMEREKFLATQAKTKAAAAAQKRAKEAEQKRIERENQRGASVERQRLDPRSEEDPMGDGSGVAKSVDRIVAKIKSAPKPAVRKPASTARKQVSRPAPKPQSFGALLRKVGGNAPATSDTAAGRRKIKLLDARARARTAARDASGRGRPSWASAAFTPKD